MVKYAGLDWLTLTSPEKASGDAWLNLFNSYYDQVKDEEPPPVEYKGRWYTGRKMRHLSWGQDPERGFILIASGGLANEIWEKALPPVHRVTRVDLAMDVQLSELVEMARHSYDLINKGDGKIQRNYTFWQNNKGGSTLYVGSRQSVMFGRLYDKGVESGTDEPNCLWRYEVEYKKPIADVVVEAVCQTEPDERAKRIIATLADWFRERAVLVPNDLEVADAYTITQQARISTYDRKLAWLRTQVRPSVQELIEAGLGQQVITALMLPVEDEV